MEKYFHIYNYKILDSSLDNLSSKQENKTIFEFSKALEILSKADIILEPKNSKDDSRVKIEKEASEHDDIEVYVYPNKCLKYFYDDFMYIY